MAMASSRAPRLARPGPDSGSGWGLASWGGGGGKGPGAFGRESPRPLKGAFRRSIEPVCPNAAR